MAEFKSTASVLKCLEEIIGKAQEHVFLVSPVMKIPQVLFKALHETSLRGINLYFLFNGIRLRARDPGLLPVLSRAQLFQRDDLNLRCCFNEQQMMILSVNSFDWLQPAGVTGALISRLNQKFEYEDAYIRVLGEIKKSRQVALTEVLGVDLMSRNN